MRNNTKNTLRRGYRRIGGSDYAINRTGSIYKISTGQDMTVQYEHGHWSGSIKLRMDGVQRNYNVAELISENFKVSDSELRRLVGSGV